MAHYESAVRGGLHLTSAMERRAEEERDYRALADMFMVTPPSFAELLDHLATLERRFKD